MNARHKSKGNRFRHKRQRHGEAGQEFGLDPARRELGEIGLREVLRAKAVCKSRKGRFAGHGNNSLVEGFYFAARMAVIMLRRNMSRP